MELSPYIQDLRRELGVLTRFAPDDVVRVAAQLAEALDAAVRLTLLDVLSTAAAEITSRLDDAVIDVRLAGGDPEFVVTSIPPAAGTGAADEAPAGGPASGDDAGTARITLRLGEGLKARIEAQAAADGVSVNSWLAQAAARALDDPRSGRRSGGTGRGTGRGTGLGNRISGYARS
ncbi:MAG: toxin-antitoxin system HicB family antitoxin [Streptosporangiaceae bacterium]